MGGANDRDADGLDRRGFLALGGGLVGAALLPRTAQAATTPAWQLTALTFPRAFAFRQAEVLANYKSYADWSALFKPLAGIEMKLLAEERTDTVTGQGLAYARQFKLDNPKKLVLLHLNGQGRLPEFETTGWFAGWWLYKAGTLTQAAIDDATTTLPVASTSVFTMQPDAFGNTWADLVITELDAAGKPDFSLAEHVRLVSVDAVASTITVVRGQYGSPATAWAAGVYIAQHVTAGTFYPGGNKCWHYNFSTVAPLDPSGRHVIDAIDDGLRPRFAPAGSLAFVDGIELDVFDLAAAGRHNIDADGDGIADAANVGGVDVYSAGLANFTARLRDILGSARILAVDGGRDQQPDPANVNGVELEGVPFYNDPTTQGWSTAISWFSYEQRSGFKPAFSYAMYKLQPPLTGAARFARFRLALAASLVTDAAFTFYDDAVPGSLVGLAPGPNAGNFKTTFTIWNELLGDLPRHYGWLGAASGPAVHLADARADLYQAAGTSLTPSFVAQVVAGAGTVVTRSASTPPFLFVKNNNLTRATQIDLPPVDPGGPELVLSIEVRVDAQTGLPATVPRVLTVAANGKTLSIPVDAVWTRHRFALRAQPAGPVAVRLTMPTGEKLYVRNIVAVAGADVCYREFQYGAVFANPSDSPITLDLSTLTPGATWKRLTASANQDPTVNDGSTLGATLTLAASDALVVNRV